MSCVVSVAAFGCMLAIATLNVRTGKGLDGYRTHWLAEDNWIGFLVFSAAAALASIVALWLRHRERREWHELGMV